MAETAQHNNKNQERSKFNKRARATGRYLQNAFFFFYPGAVSKIHQQEATEKYWILWRDVEILYNRKTDELGINGTVTLSQDPRDIDTYIKEQLENIEQGYKNITETVASETQGVKNTPPNNNPAAKHPVDCTTQKQLLQCKSHLKLLLYFYKILVRDRRKITRREGDLNILWRDITFIRTRMLTEKIIDPQKLPYQLDYCRGEAMRLGIQDNEELQEIIIDAAVDLDQSDTVHSNSDTDKPPPEEIGISSNSKQANTRTIRNLVRLLTRLNNRRLKRLHEQRMNKIMYQFALSILLLLSCILLHAHDYVMAPHQATVDCGTEVNEQINQEQNIIERTLDTCRNYMHGNPLFFIFFAGLTGGFLSTVMRLGQGANNSMPGDDAYYAWYALTKPVVGALAAAILYVIFRADFIPTTVFNEKFITDIMNCPVGAKGFAFGCIMGFSERIIMPKVK